jgi:hypothetical protein
VLGGFNQQNLKKKGKQRTQGLDYNVSFCHVKNKNDLSRHQPRHAVSRMCAQILDTGTERFPEYDSGQRKHDVFENCKGFH